MMKTRINRTTGMALGAMCALLITTGFAWAAPGTVRATLAEPSVRLWYEGTGRLSANILQNRDFALWNVIIGEGSAEENVNDVLFSVVVRTNGQQNVAQPLRLSAVDAKGKVLASRTVQSILTNESGRMVAPLWVRDVGCAGKVTFTATLGASKQTASLSFDCGE